MILADRPGTDGVVALAWRRMLRARGPTDPALEAFADYWLGRGAAIGRASAAATAPLRLALYQMNATVGDIAGNAERDPRRASRAARDGGRRSSCCSPSWR